MSRYSLAVTLAVFCGIFPFSVPCRAQETIVKFKVVVPPSTPRESKIFIAGNHSLLGDWNPGNVELRRLNDSVWVTQFTIAAGYNLEYKITRGGWNAQAIYDDGIVPGNSRLVMQGDTEVVIRPKSWSDGFSKSVGGIVGTVRYHKGLQGEGLNYSRDLIVWLPPSYGKEPARRYPVLYMHDGQNIIDPGTSFIGYDWKVDEVADSLIRAGRMEEVVIVGIYNTPDRMAEYADTKLGHAYADFVVRTVKPFIDSAYRTKPDRSNTAVMGSSMGGLMSFLFVWWYPELFSKAGCLSSVFSYDHDKLLKQVQSEMERMRDVKIYMDCGGYAGEATLKPGMDKMIELLMNKGYVENRDFMAFFDPQAEHNERAWSVRIWRPLEFFFGTEQ